MSRGLVLVVAALLLAGCGKPVPTNDCHSFAYSGVTYADLCTNPSSIPGLCDTIGDLQVFSYDSLGNPSVERTFSFVCEDCCLTDVLVFEKSVVQLNTTADRVKAFAASIRKRIWRAE